MEKPYLSDMVDYKRDIEPYPFIQIFSGVGSGKNVFINKLINGHTYIGEDGEPYTVPPKSVLLITSRRAKVEEIKNDSSTNVGSYIYEWQNGCAIDDIDQYLESRRELPDLDGLGKPVIYQRSIACTNAAIEKFLQKNYTPFDARSHLWERFDFIVLDEAHSVLADSTYQSAPFYVFQLVNKVIKENKKGNCGCKVIIMTGSPKILSSFHTPKNGHNIDLMEQCRNVRPEKLSFVDSLEAQKDLLRRLDNGERTIYFANHITTIFEIYSLLPPELQEATAFSFSREDRLDLTKPDQKILYDRMRATERFISEKQEIPENIKLLLTTSRNKEGINIMNPDINAIYVETHAEVEIIQMAGRVREGFSTLYIITDSKGFVDKESSFEYVLSGDNVTVCDDETCSLVELTLVDLCNAHFFALTKVEHIDLKDDWRKPAYSYEKLSEFIDYIHAKFPYIRFDYMEDRFVLYKNRCSGKRYYAKQDARFNEAKKSCESLEALAQSWYKEIPVIWPKSLQSQIDQYIAENITLGEAYGEAKRAQIKAELGAILGEEVSQMNRALKPYGYKETRNSHNRKSSTIGTYRIIKLKE